jgi:glycosyltransferase involved in cell wall biosynthesis
LHEIVFFSDFPFGFHNREPEERMARFAARGYRVLYVEKLGVRNPHLRHLPRILRSLRAPAESAADSPFDRLSPKLLPPRRAPVVDTINRRWLARQVLSRVEDPHNATFWIRHPTPELVPLIDSASPRLVVYELVDEHARSPGLQPRLQAAMRDSESRILARADVVFASAPQVHRRLSALHGNVVLAPAAAVDVDEFADVSARIDPTERVAAWVGAIDFRFDGELLADVARRLPDWRFVVAGPVFGRESVVPLLQAENVDLPGSVASPNVPELVAGASVLLMPYRRDEFGDMLFPVKLIEYLAAGRPVVGTPIGALADFSDVIAFAADPASFAAAVERVAAEDTADARTRRIARARPYSWDTRIDQMEAAIREALAPGATPT